MAILKPFKAIRPVKDKAPLVASKPYDVINAKEARIESRGNDLSFLHIVKPEIDFPDEQDPYAQEVYIKGRENFKALCENNIMVQDETECYYIYMLEKDKRQQTGIVGCAGIEDYFNDQEAIIFIEWGNLMQDILPLKHYEINLKLASDNTRQIKIFKKN